MMSHPTLLRVSAVLCLTALLAPASVAQSPMLGRPAPPLQVPAWVNVRAGRETELAKLRGKLVLLEFWGTCKKDCMKMRPRAPELHERYAGSGLEVLVISYDPVNVIEDLVERMAYTVPIACDPTMEIFRTYRVPEVPTACLVDAEGTIVYYGFPDEVEIAIRAGMGQDADPAVLLGAFLDWRAERGGEEDRRRRLALLIASAPRAFDLRAWALERAGLEPPGDAGAASDEPPAATLDDYAHAAQAGDGARASAILAELAARGRSAFDLRSWALDTLGALHPIGLEELERLLAARNHDAAADALQHRRPTPEVGRRAADESAFVDYCRRKSVEARALARKGLMAERWLFAGVEPEAKQRFWADLGSSGLIPAIDGEAGLNIGSERVTRRTASSYVDEQLARYLTLSSIASGRAPDVRPARARIDAERERHLAYLFERYGARDR